MIDQQWWPRGTRLWLALGLLAFAVGLGMYVAASQVFDRRVRSDTVLSPRWTDSETLGTGRYEVLQDVEDARYPSTFETLDLIQRVDGAPARVPEAGSCQRHMLDWFPTFSKQVFSCIGVASIENQGPIRMESGGDAADFRLRSSPKGAVRNENAFAAAALVMAAASLACFLLALFQATGAAPHRKT